jgi:hypothetical protein
MNPRCAPIAAALVAAVAWSAPAVAAPEEVPLGQEAPPIRNHRTFGFGVGGGGGLQLFLSEGITPSAPVILPSIELQLFPWRRRDWSLDFTVPIWNTIVIGARGEGIFLQTDAFLDFNVGKGNVRAVVGPGLGFAYRDSAGTSGGITGSVRVNFELGPEFLVANKHVGFRFLLRPYTELVFARRDGGLAQGLFFMFVVTGYTTRISIADAEP